MTSNQIAYASQLENARHNQAYEDETKRHNQATEALADEANKINAEKNVITATYNQQMYDLQHAYNEWYAKFSESSTKQKLQLEAQGNEIKQQMADVDEAYKMRMSDIGYIEADIKKRTLGENKRHNVAVELQTQAIAAADWWFRDLELAEKKRANDISSQNVTGTLENVRRGQDLTFDAGVISALSKSGAGFSVPGFKVDIKGLGPVTTLELFNKIIGDRYGKKEEQKSLTEGKGDVVSADSPEVISERRDIEGGKVSVPGRLR